MRVSAVLLVVVGLAAAQEELSVEDQNFINLLQGGDDANAIIAQGTTCDLNSVCVPYYLCEDNNVITDGAGLIDIRFGGNDGTPETTVNQHTDCSGQDINVCCQDPTAPVEIIDPVTPIGPDPKENLYQPVCGRRNALGVNARIFGGEDNESQFGEFPWMAAVLQVRNENLNFVAGGTLINSRVVVTAAHSVAGNGGPLTDLVVRLGEWDTQHTTEFYKHIDIDVGQVVIHELYNHARQNLHNDIALLILAEPAPLQEHIDTLCLPNPLSPPVIGSECIATGWGKDSFDDGQYQHVLKQVTLPLVDRITCESQLRNTRLGRRFRLDDSFICAGGNGADTCTGDGGSPLACPDPNNPGFYVFAGIVSWGIGCGTINVPGVYVDTTYFADWINSNVAAALG